MMEFSVLGPLEVTAGDRLVRVPAGQLRVLLGSLLCRANEVVSLDDLREHLWDGAAGGSVSTVRSYVRRLREVIAAGDRDREFIQQRPPGYILIAQSDEVDVLRFRALVAEAIAATEPAEAAELFNAALSLWRGPALADVNSDALHRDVVGALNEERLHAVEHWADAELANGKHGTLIAELTTQTARYPLRERFWAQLMLALYRSGRQADALDSYQRLQHVLAEELGIDPSDELARLHQAILVKEDSLLLHGESDGEHRTQPRAKRPHQLAADTRAFVGRSDVIDRIERYLVCGDEPGLGVMVISGSPGTGKTALAVHIGHRLRDQFPDGQLFADLNGYAIAPTRSIEEVLCRFLRALGVGPQSIPTDVDEQSALFRSLVADRRLLIVLDNVAGAEQVRGLLPGSRGSAVLITSRNNLDGLVAVDGAKPLCLDVLADRDAVDLLARILDEEPTGSERGLLCQLADECGNLPLALRIAAAQLVTRKHRDIAGYLREIRHGNRLDALSVADDDQAGTRAAFDLSYTALKPQTRCLFRLLGLIPGLDFSTPVAASLLGVPGHRVQQLLDKLVAANLVQNYSSGRYKLHDLLRSYAAQQAECDESDVERTAALDRLFSYYLHSSEQADRYLRGSNAWIEVPDRLSNTWPSTFANYQQSLAWCEKERANLLAVVREAHKRGFHRYAHSIPIILARFFNLGRHRLDLIETHEIGIESARERGDRLAEAVLLLRLGGAYEEFRNFDRGLLLLGKALQLVREIGNTLVEAATLNSIGIIYWHKGLIERADSYYMKALELHRALNNRHGESGVLANLGRIRTYTGDYLAAIDYCQQAVRLTGEFGDPNHQGIALLNLGVAYDGAGRCDEAMESYRAAIPVAKECKDRHTEALALFWLGKNRMCDGDDQQARAHLGRALSIFDDLADPRAHDVRELLAEHIDVTD